MHRKVGVSGYEIPGPFPYQQPDSSRPWVTVKDVLWGVYLFAGLCVPGKLLPYLARAVSALDPVARLAAKPLRKEIVKNLSLSFAAAPSSVALENTAGRFISNAIRQKMDDLLLMYDDAKVRCLSFSGREHLDSALSAGKGVMLVSLHWFANRASNRWLASIGYPVMSVRNHEPPDRFMGRVGHRSLQPRYVSLLHRVIRDEVYIQDRECSLKILQRLRKGGIVEIHMDVPYSRHLITRSLLGRPRQIPAGSMHLVKISGCAILPKLALGNADSLEIRIGPPLAVDFALPMEAFCESHLASVMDVLESMAIEYPDQWELLTKL